MRLLKIAVLVSGLSVLSVNVAQAAAEYKEGYYGAVKAGRSYQNASGMDNSLRPGIGKFIAGKEHANFYSPSLGFGYQFGNGWRAEGEYSFPQRAEYTSGSSMFISSFNHHKVQSSRLMLNVYRDFNLFDKFSIFATAGIGVAKVKSSGWQGNVNRVYAGNTDTNLAYSLGAGVSYAPVASVVIDLGYRFVDSGNIQSGLNLFGNARSLQDEQMKAHLYTSEYYLGLRYVF